MIKIIVDTIADLHHDFFFLKKNIHSFLATKPLDFYFFLPEITYFLFTFFFFKKEQTKALHKKFHPKSHISLSSFERIP